jgi:hypothetical protein
MPNACHIHTDGVRNHWGCTMTFLYKYRNFTKNSLEILIKRAVYFSKSIDFNDPFDGQLLPVHFMAEMRELGYQGDNADILTANSFVQERLEGYGVLSLSRRRDNILMWSHYANAHKGFCLGFVDNLSRLFEDLDWPIHQESVRYEQEHPFSRILDESGKSSHVKSAEGFENLCDVTYALLDAALTVKHISWAHEEEERIISEQFGMHTFRPIALAQVIFGLRASPHDISTVLALLQNDDWQHVKIFQAKRGKAALTLEFDEIPRKGK